MRCQVLSSGSGGNAVLLRAGELHILLDAGLTLRALAPRLEQAGVPYRGLDHILVSHAHLDHCRSAGALAKRHGATVHCAERNVTLRSFSRSPRFKCLTIGSEQGLGGTHDEDLRYVPVPLPHDCDPTVAFRIEHEGRVMVVLTDMGHPREEAARSLAGAHVLVLEFNHDERMLQDGPYPAALKRRVGGNQGHLSNTQAQQMLRQLASDELHTLVLAHLSAKNNSPERAVEAARCTLEELGLDDVRVLVASQDEIGPNLTV